MLLSITSLYWFRKPHDLTSLITQSFLKVYWPKLYRGAMLSVKRKAYLFSDRTLGYPITQPF